MPITAIVCGVLLTLIGVGGYFYGVTNNNASLTALIPAVFGTILESLGLLAKMKEGLRKHLMHGAIVVTLLGFILTAGRLLMKITDLIISPAVISQISMAIICLVFMLLAIRSFAEARKNG